MRVDRSRLEGKHHFGKLLVCQNRQLGGSQFFPFFSERLLSRFFQICGSRHFACNNGLAYCGDKSQEPVVNKNAVDVWKNIFRGFGLPIIALLYNLLDVPPEGVGTSIMTKNPGLSETIFCVEFG